MKNNSPNRFLNPDCHFQQAFSQSGYLSCRKNGSCRSSAHILHKYVRGSRHENPKLIGKKTRAACPVNFQAVVQLFDSILGISSAAINSVDILWFVRKIGDYETIVVPGIPTGTSHNLSFDDDAAAVRPFRNSRKRPVSGLGDISLPI